MKKFLTCLFVLSLCLSLAATLISCGGNDDDKTDPTTDNKITYTVTIKDKDGAPVPGVKLMFSDYSDIFENRETDADGKASADFDTANDALGIMISSVPAGYEKPAALAGSVFHAMFGTSKEISMEIEKVVVETTPYTVKVVDQNGNAVVGAKVQICHSLCLDCDPTGANGETTKEITTASIEGSLKVKVLTVPSGYSIPAGTLEDGYHAAFADGETTVTVTVTKN